MDSAEAEQWKSGLRAQGARLTRQEDFQSAMAAQFGQLSSQLQDMHDHFCKEKGITSETEPTAAPLTAISVGTGIKLAEHFSGDRGYVNLF